MACQGDECLGISEITATSVKLSHSSMDAGDSSPYAYTVYASDGTTIVATGTTSTVSTDSSYSYDIVTGLTPNTTYIAKLDQYPSTAETFTTLADDPKVATESMWQDLANRVKAKSDVQITMTSTDPGEGAVLAADNYIAVYGGDPIIMDYSTTEIKTGAKWIDGSAIYKKTVSIGALPNNTEKSVAHNISNIESIVKVEGFAKNNNFSNQIPLPFISTTAANQIYVSTNLTNIIIGSGTDRSSLIGYVTLYYTKNS